jgi:hypothetical protein
MDEISTRLDSNISRTRVPWLRSKRKEIPQSLEYSRGIGIILFASNYISLASILAAIVFPIAVFLTELFRGTHHDIHLLVFAVILALAIVVLHRGNLSKIADGTEHKFFAV